MAEIRRISPTSLAARAEQSVNGQWLAAQPSTRAASNWKATGKDAVLHGSHAPRLRFRLEGGRILPTRHRRQGARRSEEHTSELQSLMRISYAVFCLKKKT